MADTGGLDILDNHLPQVLGALKVLDQQQVEAAAQAVAAYAAQNHPYQNQTGQAESTFYWVTKDKSTYGQGFLSGGDASTILPEIAHPTEDGVALVANATEYFLFLELGTVHMPPFPSLIPALEAVAAQFQGGEGFEARLAALLGL